MIILGIESSCDDAAAAVIETERLGAVIVRANAVANQDDVHRPYGGVVPELASRNHVLTIDPVVQRTLASAGCDLGDIDGIPLVGVNHLEGHLLAPLLENEVKMPYLALVVSGGHTALFMVEDFGRYRRLGTTRDDAAGEAFDKVAKLMGLGYPGGKIIDQMARSGNPRRVRLPRGRVKGAPLDFSFSGIKTAVALFLRSEAAAVTNGNDLAASFQEAVADM